MIHHDNFANNNDNFNQNGSFSFSTDDQIPYFQAHVNLIRNPDLSPEAKTFIIYFLSHTQEYRKNKLRQQQILHELNLSKNKFYRILKECMEKGYVKREIYFENNLKKFRYQYSQFKKFLRYPQIGDLESRDIEIGDRKEEQEEKHGDIKESKPKKASPKRKAASKDALASKEAHELIEEVKKRIREKRQSENIAIPKDPTKKRMIEAAEKLLKEYGREWALATLDAALADEDFWQWKVVSITYLWNRFAQLDPLRITGKKKPQTEEEKNKSLAKKLKNYLRSYPENDRKSRVYEDKFVDNEANCTFYFNWPQEKVHECIKLKYGDKVVRELDV